MSWKNRYTEFKIGDKVKCVDNKDYDGSIEIGMVAVITHTQDYPIFPFVAKSAEVGHRIIEVGVNTESWVKI